MSQHLPSEACSTHRYNVPDFSPVRIDEIPKKKHHKLSTNSWSQVPSLKLTLKLTQPLKMMVPNRNLLFQGAPIFRCYVSFREGNHGGKIDIGEILKSILLKSWKVEKLYFQKWKNVASFSHSATCWVSKLPTCDNKDCFKRQLLYQFHFNCCSMAMKSGHKIH